VDPEGNLDLRYKPEETAVTLAAKQSYLGRVYLDWARYPITETEKLWPPQEGYIVLFQDLRFAQLPNLPFLRRDKNSRPLSVGVQLDKNLDVVAYIFGSGKDRIVAPEPGSASHRSSRNLPGNSRR
jgi:hypothetical protein